MALLRLFFQNGSSPTLERSVFEWPELKVNLIAVRGKTGGAISCDKTFQWTPAVRALSILAVRTAARTCEEGEVIPSIRGEGGTYAASLDYAISKQPAWLSDMFGSDAQGIVYARRLIKRTNPERKRSGPVILAFNPNQLSANDIGIYLDDRRLEGTQELSLLSEKLEGQASLDEGARRSVLGSITTPIALPVQSDLLAAYFKGQTEQGSLIAPFDNAERHTWLRNLYRNEIVRMLRRTDIFNAQSRRDLIKNAESHTTFKKWAGLKKRIVSDIDDTLPSLGVLGLYPDERGNRDLLKGDEPLKVAFISVHTATLAILNGLKYLRGYNLDLMARWVSSTNLAFDVASGNIDPMPHVLGLNLGASAWLLSQSHKHEYEPFMLLPGVSHRVLSPAAAKSGPGNINSGCFRFMTEIPSSSSFYFDDLKERGVLNSRRVRMEEMDLANACADLRTGDPEIRAILPFPLSHLSELFSGATMIDSDQDGINVRETVLWIHRSLHLDKKLSLRLNSLVRDMWLELAQAGGSLESIVDLMTQDRAHVKFLTRIAAIHNLDWGAV